MIGTTRLLKAGLVSVTAGMAEDKTMGAKERARPAATMNFMFANGAVGYRWAAEILFKCGKVQVVDMIDVRYEVVWIDI